MRQAEVREGDIVAGYRVLGVLGVGGSGTVYRAERVVDGSSVALKLLNAEHARNEGERQRFAREAEVVRQLAHPHVVALLDYGFSDDLPYLVFPLLTGRTLEARIAAEGKVGWGLTGRFSEQALSALEVAHGLSIAHRDIKPANIFCCQEGPGEFIQILDFGTAKIVGPKNATKQDVTRMGVLVGTPRYMAPEQVRGEALTPAADVYSFGLVMAEMLLGRPLVTGGTDFEMYVSQGSDAPHVLPEEILNSPYAAVIERAVAKPLEVRYRLASQMLADVRAILARYDRGAASQRLGADLEVTQFIGAAPLPAPVNESAAKLRTAFNAIASKASAVTAPEEPPSARDESALPTLFMPVVQPPPPSPSPALADEITIEETQPDDPPSARDSSPAVAPPVMLADTAPAPEPTAPVRRSSHARATVALAAVGALATAAAVVAYVGRANTSPPGATATSSSAPIAPAAPGVGPTESVASTRSAAPPPTAPPGAFTTPLPDRAALGRLLADKTQKQTPEVYEIALQAMADCEIAAGKEPTCPAWTDYEAVLKKPMPKDGAKKRLAVATKYLLHEAPSVRTLAARMHATAKPDEDFDPLLTAAKIEPIPAVLSEMLAAMRGGGAELDTFKLEALGHASPLVRSGACAGLAARPGSWPLEAVKRGARDAVAEVRTACFAALTAAWVRTADPRKEAYEETLAILEAKPRDPSRLPDGLGRLRDATLRFSPEDTDGPRWLEKADFYDATRLANTLQDLALDATMGLAARASALDALGSIGNKNRLASVRAKLEAMSDQDSKTLLAKPKK